MKLFLNYRLTADPAGTGGDAYDPAECEVMDFLLAKRPPGDGGNSCFKGGVVYRNFYAVNDGAAALRIAVPGRRLTGRRNGGWFELQSLVPRQFVRSEWSYYASYRTRLENNSRRQQFNDKLNRNISECLKRYERHGEEDREAVYLDADEAFRRAGKAWRDLAWLEQLDGWEAPA